MNNSTSILELSNLKELYLYYHTQDSLQSDTNRLARLFLTKFEHQRFGWWWESTIEIRQFVGLCSALCYFRNIDSLHLLRTILPLPDEISNLALINRIPSYPPRSPKYLSLKNYMDKNCSQISMTDKQHGSFFEYSNDRIVYLNDIYKEVRMNHSGNMHTCRLNMHDVVGNIVKIAAASLFCGRCCSKLFSGTNKQKQILNASVFYFIKCLVTDKNNARSSLKYIVYHEDFLDVWNGVENDDDNQNPYIISIEDWINHGTYKLLPELEYLTTDSGPEIVKDQPTQSQYVQASIEQSEASTQTDLILQEQSSPTNQSIPELLHPSLHGNGNSTSTYNVPSEPQHHSCSVKIFCNNVHMITSHPNVSFTKTNPSDSINEQS